MNISINYFDNMKDEYLVDWICPTCKVLSKVKDYCEPCESKETANMILEGSKRMALQGLEEQYKAKYGTNFTKKVFIVESDAEKRANGIIMAYLRSLKSGNNQSKGILLFGGQGTGKSMYSNFIQYQMNLLGKPGVRTTQYLLYQECLEEYASSVLKKYTTPDFLYLDEIGRMNKTDNAYHTFFNLINERHSQNKQTILTTNLMEGIGEYLDADRLKDFVAAKFTWESRRGR